MSMQSPSGESPLPSPASAPNAPSAGQASAVETSGSPGSGGTHSAAPFSVPGVRITSVLGRGGFATVYAGVVQAASRISGHPHVVSLVDTGKLPDLRPYLVMELCSGGSLYDLVSRGPTPASDAVALVQAAASALGAAHAAGVTHRDVKPANILLDSYGSPRLSDFGIASVQREGQDPTVTLECLTPDFAAPEAFMLARPGPEGDVWSMGAVLFALLTGRGPRRGPDGVQRSLPEIVRSLDEPLNLNDPNVPDLLLPVLSKAMAPDPKDRFRNGAELTSALERLREQLGTGSLAVGGPVTSLQLVDAGLASPSGHRAVGSMGSNSLAGALSQPSADSARSAHSVRSAVSVDSNRLEHSGGAPMLLSSPDSFPLNSPASVETGASLRPSDRSARGCCGNDCRPRHRAGRRLGGRSPAGPHRWHGGRHGGGIRPGIIVPALAVDSEHCLHPASPGRHLSGGHHLYFGTDHGQEGGLRRAPLLGGLSGGNPGGDHLGLQR